MAANLAEQKEKAVKTLAMMFDYLGLDAEVRSCDKNEKISLKINSKEPGRIIGKNGQTLDSMQYLLNLMMFSEDKECPKIMLDIDGYAKNNGKGRSDRRSKGGKEKTTSASMLKQQALDAAKEVKRWGDPVTLPPMNARDRRVIHMTLKDDAEVTTQSEGEGAMKKVVISAKAE